MDTPQEAHADPLSPQKGKGIDADLKNWRAGWWDIYPCLERPKRPLVWSQSSVIFAAHATQPIITGRHFSSSKQFVLPSPTPITSSPTFYEPPSIITVSPGDTHLLAYFPRRDGEGTACLWKRGPQIDNWQVKECWNYPKGSGIVAASWLGTHREWVISTSGPTRLPTRGPSIPATDLTLLLVTQDNYVHATYYRQYAHGLKTIRRSLQFQGISRDQADNMDYGEIPNHTRQCVDAAIGLGYNENTVFIATHSRRAPSPSVNAPTVPTFSNIGLPMEEDPLNLSPSEQRTNEWENWGNERSIEVYELHIRFDGVSPVLYTNQIANLECPPLSLSSLSFVSIVPQRPTVPPDAGVPQQPKPNLQEKGKLGLITAFVDFHAYSKLPTSTLTLYMLHSRLQPSSGRNNPVWGVVQTSTRTIDQGIITHIEPVTDLLGPMVYACVLNMSGMYNAVKSKHQQVSIGTIQVLTLPNFSEHPNWVPSDIKTSLDRMGSDFPLYVTISPNRRLLCALSSSLMQSSVSMHPLPSPAAAELTNPRLAMSLSTAILSRVSTADIVNTICSSDFSVADAADVLYQTLKMLDNFNNSSSSLYASDIVGIATEVYRLKSSSSKVELEIELSRARWKAAHEMCSVIAIILAFQDFQENSGYDLDAVWHLISLSTWVIEFAEEVMRTCVLASNATLDSQDQSDSDMLTRSILLNISHPFTLRNFIAALNHVKALRVFLGSLPAGSENAQMAQTVLLDTVDCSGVDFGGLTCLLQEQLEVVLKMEPNDCRKALVTCRPTQLMRPQIYQLAQKISQSETLLNKSALFIKPHDLIDGIARLSLGSLRKPDEKDIITKSPLSNQAADTCLRCGGKSTIDRNSTPARGHFHSKWHLYELAWQLRCICGGQWSKPLM